VSIDLICTHRRTMFFLMQLTGVTTDAKNIV
jgi:hypothetical protein